MAPEVFWERKYGKTSDIYSVGIMLYMLANGNKMPFFDTVKWYGSSDAERWLYRGEVRHRLPHLYKKSQEMTLPFSPVCPFQSCNRDRRNRF